MVADRRQLTNRPELDAILERLSPPVIALSVIVAILAVMATSSWASSNGARSALREAELAAAVAEARASELAVDLADFRREAQSRASSVADLEATVAELSSELSLAQQGQVPVAPGPAVASTEGDTGDDLSAVDATLAEVTTAIATTENVTRAIHVTDVVDPQTMVGFDLREMLADGPTAGRGITIRLAGITTPAVGDCGRRQAVALTTAWLEAADFDILLRRPAGAPATDSLGRQVAEVLAFANPSSSLNVTLVVAGDAIVEAPGADPDPDPDLTERTQSAQASAEAVGQGVWACPVSALLGRGAAPTPTPIPTAIPADGPTVEPSG